MRPIKFRAWDKEKQQIYPVTSFHSYRPEVEHGGEYCGVTIKDENRYDKFLDNERAIPMQFTGLLDKNGKEIYESDILSFMDQKRVVRWSQELGQWLADGVTPSGNIQKHITKPLFEILAWSYEVIGNIYENSNILDEDSSRPVERV